jgi:hypothetical protein
MSDAWSDRRLLRFWAWLFPLVIGFVCLLGYCGGPR